MIGTSMRPSSAVKLGSKGAPGPGQYELSKPFLGGHK